MLRRGVKPKEVARTVAAGLAGAFVLFALLELAARIVEPMRSTPRDPDWVRARDTLLVDRASGEPHPSLFVEFQALLAIRSTYTGGAACHPFRCLTIPIERRSQEYRIACFGESSTNGADLSSPGRLLAVRAAHLAEPERPFCDVVAAGLQATLPGWHVTSYNFGAYAFDSEKNLPVIREVARRLRFDLWIVYMGHNEFLYAPDLVGPYSSLPEWLRPGSRLRSQLALARLAQGVEGSRVAIDREGRARRYSARVFVKAAHYARAQERVHATYERALREVVALARAAGATLILSELVSNHGELDADELLFNCFQHGTTRAEMARVRREYERGRALEASGQQLQALEVFRRLAEKPTEYQPAATSAARCLLALGRRREALAFVYAAIDLNPLPAVATRRLTEIVRRVASETRTPLARPIEDLDRAFLDEPGRYDRLFLDDCHPTGAGHRVLAEHMLTALRETKTLPRP